MTKALRGEVLEKKQACVLRGRAPSPAGQRVSRERRPELPAARQDVPNPRRVADPSQGQGELAMGSGVCQAGPAARMVRGGEQRGQAGETSRRPEALQPTLTADSYPSWSSQTAPVQLQAGRGQSQARPRPSSSQEAAGRAGRAGQAAQEKPRLVPPLPPRGPGDRAGRGFSEPQQPEQVPSPARGSSGPAIQREARAVLPAAVAGGGRVHRDPGGGRVERVSGGEAAEGRLARRRRSESTQPVATPRAATWGAAEAPMGAPGGRTLSPRGLGLSTMALLWSALAPFSLRCQYEGTEAPRKREFRPDVVPSKQQQ
ncbi:uncharacterized protein LOC113200596 [Urocitellus parryii]